MHACMLQAFVLVTPPRRNADDAVALSVPPRCRWRGQVPAASAQLPPHLHSSKLRRTALADWLARAFAGEANRVSAAAAGQARGWHGAKGGDVTVDMPGAPAHGLCVCVCVRERPLMRALMFGGLGCVGAGVHARQRVMAASASPHIGRQRVWVQALCWQPSFTAFAGRQRQRRSSSPASCAWSAAPPDAALLSGQHVLERTAVLISAGGDVEARFTVGLPAQGRSIMGPWAAQILTQHVARCAPRWPECVSCSPHMPAHSASLAGRPPTRLLLCACRWRRADALPCNRRAVRAALMYPALDAASIWRHISTVEDSQALRDALPGLGLVGFVGDGAVLPRKRCAA